MKSCTNPRLYTGVCGVFVGHSQYPGPSSGVLWSKARCPRLLDVWLGECNALLDSYWRIWWTKYTCERAPNGLKRR